MSAVATLEREAESTPRTRVGDDRRRVGQENSGEDHRGVVRATDQDLRTDVSQCIDILDRPKGAQALRQGRCGLYRERHLPALPSNGSEAKLPRTAPRNSSRLCFNGLQSPFRAMAAMGHEREFYEALNK